MAALAMLLQDGQNVAIEGGRGNQGLRRLGRRLRRGLILLLLRGGPRRREHQKQNGRERDSQEIMDARSVAGVFGSVFTPVRIVHRVRW
jgi:hypothetical protein